MGENRRGALGAIAYAICMRAKSAASTLPALLAALACVVLLCTPAAWAADPSSGASAEADSNTSAGAGASSSADESAGESASASKSAGASASEGAGANESESASANAGANESTSAGESAGASASASANSSASASANESTGESETIAVDFTGQDEGYSAVLYDNSNGLPTSEANDIAQTPEGFIWIGSYSGLIRYDGYTFERIDSTQGIASVTSLFVDSKDRLWVGTNDSGVAVIERGNTRMFGKVDGLASASVRAIAEDPEGNIYVATTQGIAAIDAAMNVRMLDDEGVKDAYLRDLRAGADGVLYGITMDDTFFTLEGGKLKDFYDGKKLGLTGIVSLLPDSANPGYIFLGTQQSVVYHGKIGEDAKQMREIDVAPLTYVRRIERFQDKVCICADNGISMMEHDKVRKLENIPLDSPVEHAMADYEGNLWFASTRQGVMKIVPNQFSNIYERYSFPTAVVNSTCKYDGNLFVGTDSGLTVLGPDAEVKSIPLQSAQGASGAKIEATDLVELLDGSRIRSIIRDSKNRLWFSTFGDLGVVCYDGTSATRYAAEEGLPSEWVRTVYERRDGTIMVACTGGVALLGDRGVEKVYDKDAGLTNTEILTTVEAPNGDIVLGTDGGGIFVISGDETRHISVEEGLSSDVVMRIKRDDANGVFWIVTSNSIAYMSLDYQVTTIRNFPYSNNFDLYESADGDMWVLSSNGIYVVPVAELLANGNISPIYYGTDNGLPCIATANSYSELTDEGELFIAGTTGVAQVNIDTPFETVSDVKMAVPFVDADETRIYPDAKGGFTIPAETQRLTVYGFVFSYSLMNPQVTYHLDGLEDHSVTVRASGFDPVDYTNLAGGDYHFVMQLADASGNGNKQLSVSITKALAFYEELWFRALCIVALIGLIALGIRIYIGRKTQAFLKKEQENKELVREMTQAFAKTIDMKDKYTNGHSSRVAEYTALLTRELGYDEDTVERYYNIALLHDIGKIGVPGDVLNKPGKLTDEEYETIKSHAALGHEALKDISIMPELATGAGAHHERPDGRGYPNGLSGDEIPRVAQIIAVADAFDAMYSNRPYRNRMNFEKVVAIITDVSGTQLTSDVVDAFLRLVERGEFRDPDDVGGGSTEDIDNIRNGSSE